MKYIRTKNRIYKALEDYMQSDLLPAKIRVEDVAKDWHIVISKNQVIKQADTIEELCDEFRVRDNDNYSTYEIDIGCRNLKELYEELQIQNQTLFGAIWTEWGLKYVAKMNDEGELELL